MADDDSNSPIPKQIEELDLQILQAIKRRGSLIQGLGEKSPSALDAQRYANQLVKSQENGGSEFDSATLLGILGHIHSACLHSAQKVGIAYLGPKYSYSHLAAIKAFGEAANFVPVSTIASVFDAVTRGDAAMGLVPIENSTDGRIVDTLGMFVRQEIEVCGEVILPIHHNLLSRTPRDQIDCIQSKPQALSQCRSWLAANFPQAKLVEVSSTTVAAQQAHETTGVAAVASLEAGRQYGLDVIQKNIEDNPDNVTRFAVLGRERCSPSGDDKTSVLFQVYHKPGALADAMQVFKENGLNLTWIESFPAPGTPDEYLFFVELSGHRDDPPVSQALNLLQQSTFRLNVLGSYPKAYRE